MQKYKRYRITKIIFKKNKIRGLVFPNFNTYYKVMVIKTVWYWHTDRHTDPWNKLKSPGINSYVYGQLIFTKAL